MNTSSLPLVLGSGSPRRAEILQTLRIAFEVRPSGVDEKGLDVASDADLVSALASAKLERVLMGLRDPRFVLAADTMVCVDDEPLGQPADDRDALRMLLKLSGRSHVVKTAVALGRVGTGLVARDVVESRVWFRSVGQQELARYVATGEGRDKAGAYAIQGLASGFITRVEGSYTNVVGLPAAEVVSLLLDHGALDRWP